MKDKINHKQIMWERQRKHAQVKTNKKEPNIEPPVGSLQRYVEQHDKIEKNKIKKNL